jgi:hypothetical protein
MKEKKENYNYRVGFSALSAASYLAKGHEVVVYEKMLLLVEEQDN